MVVVYSYSTSSAFIMLSNKILLVSRHGILPFRFVTSKLFKTWRCATKDKAVTRILSVNIIMYLHMVSLKTSTVLIQALPVGIILPLCLGVFVYMQYAHSR